MFTCFLHTNDVHACYIAVEVFEVFMTKLVYFAVNFTFLFSSLAIIALLEHNNQYYYNATHHYHLLKSVLKTKLFKNSESFQIFPKIPNIPTKFPIFPVETYRFQNSREFCIPNQNL